MILSYYIYFSQDYVLQYIPILNLIQLCMIVSSLSLISFMHFKNYCIGSFKNNFNCECSIPIKQT